MCSKSRRWILLQIDTAATLSDTDGFEILKPFGMDLLHFYPLRGSLGRKPGRATQAKVRAREKYKKKNQKNAKAKKGKMKKNAKKRTKKRKCKEKKRKELKRKEEQSSQGRKPATGALAKVRA
ncbi:hypothetical protein HYC85_028861 [Camellia sinensis]|uniref:Uncharacterized protein n=1 Tax=Camellia sinensis TaxID=4442 RepID=A0A7J7FWA2_CAMSI|nr:hypothetical protein HYC85_028861 [Camellia sinensis]